MQSSGKPQSDAPWTARFFAGSWWWKTQEVGYEPQPYKWIREDVIPNDFVDEPPMLVTYGRRNPVLEESRVRVLYHHPFESLPGKVGIVEVVFEYPQPWTSDEFMTWLEKKLA